MSGTQTTSEASAAARQMASEFLSELPTVIRQKMLRASTDEGGVLIERRADGCQWSLDIRRDGSLHVVEVEGYGAMGREVAELPRAARMLLTWLEVH